jgi:GWxTD domain-containing protein
LNTKIEIFYQFAFTKVLSLIFYTMRIYYLTGMLKQIFTGLLLLAPGLLCGQDFTTLNLSYQYQENAPVQSNCLIWEKGPDSLQAMASLQLKGNRNLDNFRLYLYPCRELNAVDEIYRPIRMIHERSQQDRHLFQATLAQSDSIRYLVLEVQDSLQPDMSFWSVITLDEQFSYPPPPFFLTQDLTQDLSQRTAQVEGYAAYPLFRSYVREEEKLQIKGSSGSHILFYYPEDFDPAVPPMAAPANSSNNLTVAETLSISRDSVFSLQNKGLYFIQHDTTQLSGHSFRLTNRYFPEVGTLSDFAGPIRYLSTNEEWEQLKSADFSKKELDRFWLKVAQTEDRAKRIIRSYYHRVEQANELFTNYKEGWKTDQGMIYILYGNPDQVQMLADREVWIYRQTADLPEIKFTFVRVKNPFTNRHLVLLRNKNYTRAHYQIVSQWRRGKKAS